MKVCDTSVDVEDLQPTSRTSLVGVKVQGRIDPCNVTLYEHMATRLIQSSSVTTLEMLLVLHDSVVLDTTCTRRIPNP